MSMAQVGTLRYLNLQERGTLVTGGSIEDRLVKTETIMLGDGKLLDESPSKAETVIITNV